MKLNKLKIKLKNLTDFCSNCGRSVLTSKISLIRFSFYDGTHYYKDTKRKFISHYKMKLCPACFKKFKIKFNKIIETI